MGTIRENLELETISDEDCLYHYTKCGSMVNILRSGRFYATKSSFLNDTNEMDYIMSVAAAVISELDNLKWRDVLMKQVVNTMEEFKRHDTFILSFSKEEDSITLWSEFGEETGYCAAFRGKKLMARISGNQDIYCHGNVIYSLKQQKEIIRHLLMEEFPAKTGKTFEELMEEEISHPDSKAFLAFKKKLRKALNIYAMFFKQEEFAPEREYRFAFRNPDKKKIKFREKEGFLLPYIEIDVTGGKSGKMPIDHLTVAPKNHVDLAKKGMTQFMDQLGYNVPIGLSRLKLRY
ncbi:MAG: DUF2971 domain-containing protein [Eubacterium sp.]